MTDEQVRGSLTVRHPVHTRNQGGSTPPPATNFVPPCWYCGLSKDYPGTRLYPCPVCWHTGFAGINSQGDGPAVANPETRWTISFCPICGYERVEWCACDPRPRLHSPDFFSVKETCERCGHIADGHTHLPPSGFFDEECLVYRDGLLGGPP